MSVLLVSNLDGGYGKKQVLFDVSLEMSESQMMLVIGANGSGKSTFLKTVFGLLSPWNSNALIEHEDRSILNKSPGQLRDIGISYIPQQNELFDDLNVLDNLRMASLSAGGSESQESLIKILFELTPRFERLLESKAYQLSGGERKLLSFAMATISKPKLLLIDEPLAGVSEDNVSLILEKLQSIRKLGVSIIIVEHQIRHVFNLADKIVAFKLGRVYEEEILTLESTGEIML